MSNLDARLQTFARLFVPSHGPCTRCGEWAETCCAELTLLGKVPKESTCEACCIAVGRHGALAACVGCGESTEDRIDNVAACETCGKTILAFKDAVTSLAS